MNRESKLHGNAMCTDCENLIKALNAEILCFKTKIETLKKFTDNNSEGDSVEAMNARCLELSAVIEKMIEGDKKDIQDLKLLKEKVRDVYIDGEDVLEKMDTAQRGARECYEKAVSLSHAAELAETPWEKDYLNGLASASRSQGESWDRIYDFWKGQAELYDEIDSETSSLFADGIAYHREASTMMVSFLQCRLTAPSYTGSKSRKISKNGSKEISGVSKEEIYKYNHDYLLRNGFSEEQIEYLYRTKPELFSSLYITAHCASDSCPAIIQNMRDELNKVVEKYQFLVDDIKKRWNMSDEEATMVLFKLEKYHRLESLYGTYYHSQTEYYSLLDNYTKRCDSWANDHMNELNKTSFALNWNEEEKGKTLRIYYWEYVFCADENLEKVKELESDNCKFAWEENKRHSMGPIDLKDQANESSINSRGFSDEDIEKDIQMGLYTREDYNYLLALSGESNTYEGFYAVACCVRNRIKENPKLSYRDVITAPNQFTGFKVDSIGKPLNDDIKRAAVEVLRGGKSTVGSATHFFGRLNNRYLWCDKEKCEYFINIGGNIFYAPFGSVSNNSETMPEEGLLICDNKGNWEYGNGQSWKKE